jgi:hypothetical protein
MSWGQLMLYVAFAVVAAVVVLAAAGPSVREWRRNASLRREMRTQPIVFRTEVRQVRFPDAPWWRAGGELHRWVDLIIRGEPGPGGSALRAGDVPSVLLQGARDDD